MTKNQTEVITCVGGPFNQIEVNIDPRTVVGEIFELTSEDKNGIQLRQHYRLAVNDQGDRFGGWVNPAERHHPTPTAVRFS